MSSIRAATISSSTLFYRQPTNSAEALRQLKEKCRKTTESFEELKKLIAYAFQNQNPPKQETSAGTIYHIQAEDFKACENKLAALEAEHNSIKCEFMKFYNNLQSDKQEKFKNDFERCATNLGQELSNARSQVCGRVMGLEFLMNNPTATQRREVEREN